VPGPGHRRIGTGNGRTGDDPVGPRIAGLSARPAWSDDLNGAVYAQPLIDGGTVYVATENDSVYAVSAAAGAVLWRAQVGVPVSLSVVDSAPTLSSGCGDINPLGITGTPVIDPARDQLFVAEETEAPGREGWAGVQHWLIAISLASHRELWHRQIDPPHPNNAGTYHMDAEQERSALTLSDGRLYVPFGGLYGDCGQYHGYVEELAESGRGQVGSYQVPTQREGGIWGTSGIVVSATGDLYFATGNGSSNSVAHFDEGNAVVELSSSLARVGVWAPSDWVELNDQDWDLGSAGPVQVPGTSLLFAAGKPAQKGSFGSLVREGHLGGIGHGAYTAALCPSGGVFGADAAATVGTGKKARTFIYAACGSGTEGVEVSVSPLSFRTVWRPSTGTPNGPPVVAGGLVWALDWDGGELYGMAPTSGHVVITRSTSPLEHFATPAVGDNLVLVPTQDGVEAFRAVS
jgi:outer membrane protein assembly factor BamB